MKYIILFLSIFLSSNIFAHENPPRKGTCFLVRNGNPETPKPCTIYSGGGAGGSYVKFKVGSANILIEEVEGEVGVGSSPEHLKDGNNYMRDAKTLKEIPYSEEDIPKYFCAKQTNGNLDACFK